MPLQRINDLDLAAARFFMTYEQPSEVMQSKLQTMDSRLVVGDPSSGTLFSGPKFQVMFDSDRPYGKRSWMLTGSSIDVLGKMVEKLRGVSDNERDWIFSPFHVQTPTILMEVTGQSSAKAHLGYLLDTSQEGRFDRMAVGFDPLEGTIYQQFPPVVSKSTQEVQGSRFKDKFMIASRYCAELQSRLEKVMSSEDQDTPETVADRLFTDVLYLYCEENIPGCERPLGGFATNMARSEIDPEEREARMPGASFVEEIKATTQWRFSEHAALSCWMPMVGLQGSGGYSVACESEDISATQRFVLDKEAGEIKNQLAVALMSVGNSIEESYLNRLIGIAISASRYPENSDAEQSGSSEDVYRSARDLY